MKRVLVISILLIVAFLYIVESGSTDEKYENAQGDITFELSGIDNIYIDIMLTGNGTPINMSKWYWDGRHPQYKMPVHIGLEDGQVMDVNISCRSDRDFPIDLKLVNVVDTNPITTIITVHNRDVIEFYRKNNSVFLLVKNNEMRPLELPTSTKNRTEILIKQNWVGTY